MKSPLAVSDGNAVGYSCVICEFLLVPRASQCFSARARSTLVVLLIWAVYMWESF